MPAEISQIASATDSIAVSKTVIAEYLRGKIVRGELSPGERLPTQHDLRQHFGTTKVTVQRAFAALNDEGFIWTEGARGTFVADHPPHKSRYALAFHCEEDEACEGFWGALQQEARVLDNEGTRRTACFYGIERYPDGSEFKRLLQQAQTQQIAGIIFVFNPIQLHRTPLLKVPDVPMVSTMGHCEKLGIPAVEPDLDSIFDRALDELALKGCKRVAAISGTQLADMRQDYFLAGARKRGLLSKPHWYVPVELRTPENAIVYVRLLMEQPRESRPDALLIADDNLIAPVLAALKQAGLNVPGDIEIIADANFPVQRPVEPEIRRLGFQVRSILESCIDLIEHQRAGKSVPLMTTVKAVFEDELVSSSKPYRAGHSLEVKFHGEKHEHVFTS